MKLIIERFVDNTWKRVGNESWENAEEAQFAIDELRQHPEFTMVQLRFAPLNKPESGPSTVHEVPVS